MYYVYVQNPKKLDARSRKGIFVGYDKNSLLHLVYHSETKQVERTCKRSAPSILRKNGFAGMTEFNQHKIISEMPTNCPLMLDVIMAAMNHTTTKSIEDIAPKIGMCYSIMIQT